MLDAAHHVFDEATPPVRAAQIETVRRRPSAAQPDQEPPSVRRPHANRADKVALAYRVPQELWYFASPRQYRGPQVWLDAADGSQLLPRGRQGQAETAWLKRQRSVLSLVLRRNHEVIESDAGVAQ